MLNGPSDDLEQSGNNQPNNNMSTKQTVNNTKQVKANPKPVMKQTKQPSQSTARPVKRGRDVSNGQVSQPKLADLTPSTPIKERNVPRSNDVMVMNRKPVLYRHAATVLNMESDEFHEKLLCDGIVLNLGDACGFNCTYCYVESTALKLDSSILGPYNRDHGTSLGFQDVVVRRANALEVLRSQLLNEDGTSRYSDPSDNRVVYTSSLVDPAANLHLLRETAAACNLILEHTHWQIRILSKSVLMARLIEEEFIPSEYHDRLILGFSIGTLDDDVAGAIEVGASPPSMRLAALHRLQERSIRTFGMICPSIPQDDYDKFSKEICEAIRVDRCEHVWAEVLNIRGESGPKTLAALEGAGLTAEVARFNSVFFGKHAASNWEQYARQTFEAHTRHIPAGKLRFLQYLKEDAVDWWKARRADGAVLIGKVAKLRLLQAGGESAPRGALVALTQADIAYRDTREQTVQTGVTAGIAAAKALYEIHSYKDGLLWKQDHPSFEHYCRAKLHYAKAHGYRVLNLGVFITELENASLHDGDCRLPINEGQIRPLLEVVPKPNQVACWGKSSRPTKSAT